MKLLKNYNCGNDRANLHNKSFLYSVKNVCIKFNIKVLVTWKNSWRFLTDEVKSKYISVITRRAFKRWHLKLCFMQNLIKIGVVYQKLFKFKNGPESRENSLYFTIPLQQRHQHISGLWKKFVTFVVKVLYQNQQQANGSLIFVLGISMSKISPVLVD